jgi:flagellar L-ring protein precursor FlgH
MLSNACRTALIICVAGSLCLARKKESQPTPIDLPPVAVAVEPRVSSPGSLFAPGDRYGDLVRDLRAGQIGDIVTVLVLDRASAVSTGKTSTSRKSALTASINSLAGPVRVSGPLGNLAGTSGQQTLDGQGSTTRDTSLSTTISLHVVAVTQTGNLVLQGTKQLEVNSERQIVTVRGVVRPADLSPNNTVPSDRLAQLEVYVNGRGVVGDAIRRPFILYRIIMGLLPF